MGIFINTENKEKRVAINQMHRPRRSKSGDTKGDREKGIDSKKTCKNYHSKYHEFIFSNIFVFKSERGWTRHT